MEEAVDAQMDLTLVMVVGGGAVASCGLTVRMAHSANLTPSEFVKKKSEQQLGSSPTPV